MMKASKSCNVLSLNPNDKETRHHHPAHTSESLYIILFHFRLAGRYTIRSFQRVLRFLVPKGQTISTLSVNDYSGWGIDASILSYILVSKGDSMTIVKIRFIGKCNPRSSFQQIGKHEQGIGGSSCCCGCYVTANIARGQAGSEFQ